MSFSICFRYAIRFAFGAMTKANLIHNSVNCSLTGNIHIIGLLHLKSLIHTNFSIGIVTFALRIYFHHCISECLIFPWTIPRFQIIIESLLAYMQHPAVERDFAFSHAVISLYSDKLHPLL